MQLKEIKSFIDQDLDLSFFKSNLLKEWGGVNDPAHDLDHVFRVAKTAIELSNGKLDQKSIVVAALFHDLVNLPKNHPERALASKYSADKARSWLLERHFAQDKIEEICIAIEDHSFSRGNSPRNFLAEVIQDADRLEALGALGLYRMFAVGLLQLNTRLFDPEDPWAKDRKLDDLTNSVDHCFTKLRNLPKTMRTESGKKEAKKRFKFMEEYLNQLWHEIGHPREGNIK